MVVEEDPHRRMILAIYSLKGTSALSANNTIAHFVQYGVLSSGLGARLASNIESGKGITTDQAKCRERCALVPGTEVPEIFLSQPVIFVSFGGDFVDHWSGILVHFSGWLMADAQRSNVYVDVCKMGSGMIRRARYILDRWAGRCKAFQLLQPSLAFLTALFKWVVEGIGPTL